MTRMGARLTLAPENGVNGWQAKPPDGCKVRYMQASCGCRLCHAHAEVYRNASPPLWALALEAWVEREYPEGRAGRSAALEVAREAKRHATDAWRQQRTGQASKEL